MIGLLLIMYDVIKADAVGVIACIAVDIAVHVAATFVLYWLILLLLHDVAARAVDGAKAR